MNFISSFFQKRKLRESAQEFSDALGKHLRYKRDILPEESYKHLSAIRTELRSALKEKRTGDLQGVLNKGDRMVSKYLPLDSMDWLREQVEVIFVAVITALAIRAYFYQPFKIPTDSMLPTLYGIQSVRDEGPGSDWLTQRWEQVAYGRLYHRIHLQSDATLVGYQECTYSVLKVWFDYTDLTFSNGEIHRVWCSPSDLAKQGGPEILTPSLQPSDRTFSAAQDVTFHTDAGDQVLVNKWLFNFRFPHRGEVLVFRTTNIEGIEARLRNEGVEGSEFYIKRCVGLPDDELQIQPPLLLINGTSSGQNMAMRRVEAGTKDVPKDGYKGYGFLPGQVYLRTPEEPLKVPEDGFWAMGDNSYNSLDSRFWGKVPRENIVGTGTLVWWPFGKRWGIIN